MRIMMCKIVRPKKFIWKNIEGQQKVKRLQFFIIYYRLQILKLSQDKILEKIAIKKQGKGINPRSQHLG